MEEKDAGILIFWFKLSQAASTLLETEDMEAEKARSDQT